MSPKGSDVDLPEPPLPVAPVRPRPPPDLPLEPPVLELTLLSVLMSDVAPFCWCCCCAILRCSCSCASCSCCLTLAASGSAFVLTTLITFFTITFFTVGTSAAFLTTAGSAVLVSVSVDSAVGVVVLVVGLVLAPANSAVRAVVVVGELACLHFSSASFFSAAAAMLGATALISSLGDSFFVSSSAPVLGCSTGSDSLSCSDAFPAFAFEDESSSTTEPVGSGVTFFAPSGSFARSPFRGITDGIGPSASGDFGAVSSSEDLVSTPVGCSFSPILIIVGVEATFVAASGGCGELCPSCLAVTVGSSFGSVLICSESFDGSLVKTETGSATGGCTTAPFDAAIATGAPGWNGLLGASPGEPGGDCAADSSWKFVFFWIVGEATGEGCSSCSLHWPMVCVMRSMFCFRRANETVSRVPIALQKSCSSGALFSSAGFLRSMGLPSFGAPKGPTGTPNAPSGFVEGFCSFCSTAPTFDCSSGNGNCNGSAHTSGRLSTVFLRMYVLMPALAVSFGGWSLPGPCLLELSSPAPVWLLASHGPATTTPVFSRLPSGPHSSATVEACFDPLNPSPFAKTPRCSGGCSMTASCTGCSGSAVRCTTLSAFFTFLAGASTTPVFTLPALPSSSDAFSSAVVFFFFLGSLNTAHSSIDSTSATIFGGSVAAGAFLTTTNAGNASCSGSGSASRRGSGLVLVRLIFLSLRFSATSTPESCAICCSRASFSRSSSVSGVPVRGPPPFSPSAATWAAFLSSSWNCSSSSSISCDARRRSSPAFRSSSSRSELMSAQISWKLGILAALLRRTVPRRFSTGEWSARAATSGGPHPSPSRMRCFSSSSSPGDLLGSVRTRGRRYSSSRKLSRQEEVVPAPPERTAGGSSSSISSSNVGSPLAPPRPPADPPVPDPRSRPSPVLPRLPRDRLRARIVFSRTTVRLRLMVERARRCSLRSLSS
uniref:KASH domain-containing protein n=1 Tax=Anopheles atroparvus TaxID=41427 RepID=A0AAG5DXV5_ANOAO